jgi:hypothetical protein
MLSTFEDGNPLSNLVLRALDLMHMKYTKSSRMFKAAMFVKADIKKDLNAHKRRNIFYIHKWYITDRMKSDLYPYR